MNRRLVIFAGVGSLLLVVGAMVAVRSRVESPLTAVDRPGQISPSPADVLPGSPPAAGIPPKRKLAGISAILGNPSSNSDYSVLAASLDFLRTTPEASLTPPERRVFYAAVQRLHGAAMVPTERQSLIAFLSSSRRPDALTEQQLFEIKNDILNFLRNEEPPQADVTGVLVALFRNPAQDAVVRDYAIQHLGAWFQAGHDQTEIAEVLWSALAETDSSIAGTALLALNRLAEEHPNLDKQAIGNTALDLATNEHVSNLTRITALQIAAQLGVRKALAVAKQLALDERDVPLQISAIAAVGTLGTEAENAFLNTFTKGANERLREPACSAARRLSDHAAQINP